jgi:glycosyltransferase involved in cell wall biosynthesis
VFTGALSPDGVLAELRQADVFVFPSAYESFGTAALEALAAGLPVVASDLPALREATGAHASLVALDNLDGWVDAVGQLLADANLRAARAEVGRRWAAGFTWERVVDQFETVLQAAVQASRASRADTD